MPTTVESDHVPQTAIEQITRPALIDRLLRSLCTSRSLLQVGIGGPPVFRSAILAVVSSAGELILDELCPASGHTRLLEAGRGVAAGSHEGVALRFELIVNSVGREDGMCFYRVARPCRIDYAQRRKSYRIKTSAAAGASISVYANEGRSVDGTIHDLSADGIGALFPRDTPLEVGQLLPGTLLRVDPRTRIECTLQIAFARRDPAHGSRLRVGACFVDLPKARRALRHHVAALERATVRKRR